MDYAAILNWLSALNPIAHVVLVVLGALVVLGSVYVKLTPSQTDDAWFDKLEAIPVLGNVLKALAAFSPVDRKDPQ